MPDANGFETLSFADGLPWACLRQGQGKPLLLIHGSLCDARFWQGQMTPLAEAGHEVVAPSLPAYHPLYARPDMRWQRDLDDLVQLIHGLWGEQHFDLVGHSRGGFLAYHLAQRLPQQVRRLVLAEPGGQVAQPGDTSGLAHAQADGQTWRNDVVTLLEQGATEQGVALFVDGVSRPGSWRASPPSFRQMALDNAVTLISQLRQDAMPVYRPEEVRTLSLPVLLLKGQRSLPRFQQTIDALGQYLPQAQVVEVRGASHAMNLAHPRQFNQLLADFLA